MEGLYYTLCLVESGTFFCDPFTVYVIITT
jgi:hypothetical protein